MCDTVSGIGWVTGDGTEQAEPGGGDCLFQFGCEGSILWCLREDNKHGCSYGMMGENFACNEGRGLDSIGNL